MAEDMERSVQREIDGVQQEIDGVQRKIDDVESQLSIAKDPEEKKYLREKEKQLRDEKMQLREKEKQLRDEKMQLRALQEKQRALVKGSVTQQQIEEVCAKYWTSVVETLPSMPQEKDFKFLYKRSRKELCTLKQRVVLLLQGLKEEEYFKASSDVLKMLDHTDLIFLVDASGSGKTRTLFEVACQRDCMYLTGVSSSGPVDEGSKDLTRVALQLGTYYPTGEIPEGALRLCLAILLIARFFIWKQAGPVSRLTWLFKQVYFKWLNYPGSDPWHELTEMIFALFPTSSALLDSRTMLNKLLLEVQTDTNWNGVVVIDECQELSKLLENRFRSESGNEVNRSMLDKLLVSFEDLGCRRLLVSGTGRHLIRLIDTLSESVKNRLSHSFHTDFGEFSSPEALKNFTLGYLDLVDDFDFERIFGLFQGRYRIFVTVLEMFLRESDTHNLVATDFFIRTWDRLSREPGTNLNINRSVWDDVVKFFSSPTYHPGCLEFVITLLVLQLYTGRPARIAVEDSDLQLVQAGLGRIRTTVEKTLHFKPGTDFFPTTRKAALSIRLVEIGEPIVVKSLWNYLTNTGEIQKRLINDLGSCSESELGLLFEPYSAPLLRRILERPAVDFVPKMYKSQVDEVYTHPLTLPNPGNCEQLVCMPQKDDGKFFLDWLTEFEVCLNGNERDSFRPFIHSGEVTCFGPDMVAGCIGEVKGKKKVPVVAFFQHKVTNKISLSDILDTLDVDELFLHRKSPRTRSPMEEECVRRLKKILEGGALLKWIICLTTDVSSLGKERMFASAFGSVPEIHKRKRTYQKLKAQGLVGILDKNMQVMLEEGSWFVEAVQHLKHCK